MRMRRLRELSPFACGDEDFIFRTSSKLHLTRAVMLDLTDKALKAARIHKSGSLSSKMWRAGLVTYSLDHGISREATQAVGLWKTAAGMLPYDRPLVDRSIATVQTLFVAPKRVKGPRKQY